MAYVAWSGESFPLLLWCQGAPLWQILAAGEWRSPAFLLYLDMHKLESDLVVQAHVDESDPEDDS